MAVFKIKTTSKESIDEVKELLSKDECNVWAIKENFLIVDTNPPQSHCNYDSLLSLLVELLEEGKISFYNYFSMGMYKNVVNIFNKIHHQLTNKGLNILLITYIKAYPFNYGNKKEFLIEYYQINEDNPQFVIQREKIIIATTKDLIIKRIIRYPNKFQDLIPTYIGLKPDFEKQYGYFFKNMYLFKSIIHTKKHNIKNTLYCANNPLAWQFTIFNPKWYKTMQVVKNSKVKYIGYFRLTCNNGKIYLDHPIFKNLKTQYTVTKLATRENIKQNYKSIIPEVFSIGEPFLFFQLLKQKKLAWLFNFSSTQQTIKLIQNIANFLQNQVGDCMNEAKLMYKKSQLIMTSTNFFSLMEDKPSGLSSILKDLKISGLFLELENDSGKWKLPTITKFEVGDKQIYTFNITNTALLENYLKQVDPQKEDPHYIIQENKLKQLDLKGLEGGQLNVKPVKSGEMFFIDKIGYRIYDLSKIKDINELIKTPILTFKLRGDIILVNGNTKPEFTIEIFTNKNTSVVFSGITSQSILTRALLKEIK